VDSGRSLPLYRSAVDHVNAEIRYPDRQLGECRPPRHLGPLMPEQAGHRPNGRTISACAEAKFGWGPADLADHPSARLPECTADVQAAKPTAVAWIFSRRGEMTTHPLQISRQNGKCIEAGS
jgi:hypothetical protein